MEIMAVKEIKFVSKLFKIFHDIMYKKGYGNSGYGMGSGYGNNGGYNNNNNNLPTLVPLPGGGTGGNAGGYGAGNNGGYGASNGGYGGALPTLVPVPGAGAGAGAGVITTTVAATITAAATVSTKASACFVEIGANYPVNDLTQLSSPSASDCCNLCGLNPACNAFAYQQTTNTCYLKTQAPALGGGNRQVDPTITFGTLTIR